MIRDVVMGLKDIRSLKKKHEEEETTVHKTREHRKIKIFFQCLCVLIKQSESGFRRTKCVLNSEQNENTKT